MHPAPQVNTKAWRIESFKKQTIKSISMTPKSTLSMVIIAGFAITTPGTMSSAMTAVSRISMRCARTRLWSYTTRRYSGSRRRPPNAKKCSKIAMCGPTHSYWCARYWMSRLSASISWRGCSRVSWGSALISLESWDRRGRASKSYLPFIS